VLAVGVAAGGVGVALAELAPVDVDAVAGVAANHLPSIPWPFV
jgi:hypothetical protein